MTIVVRPMRLEDARAFLDVHHAAVRGLAAKDYPLDVVEDWAPLPISDHAVEKVRATHTQEIRFIAEIDDRVVGIGALVPARNELRACYVAPMAARKGVGRKLVCAIEVAARGRGLANLELESSISAEPFYVALGYSVLERTEHVLATGRRMACVRMRKSLT
jgi:putative acetyltransferase